MKSHLEQGMKSVAEVFPADYSGPAAFTGEIHVAPLGLPQIQAVLRSFDIYHGVVAYPPGYRAMLKGAWESLYQQPANRIEIREVVVKPQPNICRIHTESLNLAP